MGTSKRSNLGHEKEVTLQALGAKIYRTPTAAKWDDPDSHISLCRWSHG